MSKPDSKILVTAGEPAGIGPDIILKYAQDQDLSTFLVVSDPDLLSSRAKALSITIDINECKSKKEFKDNCLNIFPVSLRAKCTPGQLDTKNAKFVLECLSTSLNMCLDGEAGGLVTGPIQKSIINDAGIPFSGHTEWLARETGTKQVVMMLATDSLRVALATTHIPLREVPETITQELLISVIEILHREMAQRFGIVSPRIMVCGLNPHAGESGHLGKEEEEIIKPALNLLKKQNINVTGPLPADTLFTPGSLSQADVVLAMYHDQGLPVLKHSGFGNAANITLGLPIIRTSVDHGTAVNIAGTGEANPGSLSYAIQLAEKMVSDHAKD